MVFLVPMWKDTLDFDMHAKARHSHAGRKSLGPRGFVGVANIGLDENWFGNQLSQANLYGFGRLAWNPDLTSRQIADEWTQADLRHRSQGGRYHLGHATQFLAHL